MRWVLLALLLSSSTAFASYPIPPLVSTTGQVYQPGDSATVQATVIVFLIPDCPICQRLTPALNKLSRELPPSVELFGVVSGNTHTHAESIKYASEFKLNFPVLVDPLLKCRSLLEADPCPGSVCHPSGWNNHVSRSGEQCL